MAILKFLLPCGWRGFGLKWLPFAACLLIGTSPVVPAEPVDADLIKAIYSYQFSKFTEWPQGTFPSLGATLNFCILGQSAFDQHALDAIDGKAVKGHRLRVALYQSGLLPSEQIGQCHILFVSASEQAHLNSILAALQYKPLLTISDIKDFSQRGGMITLLTEAQQVHFEINAVALNHAGLTLSSKLLELATAVYR